VYTATDHAALSCAQTNSNKNALARSHRDRSLACVCLIRASRLPTETLRMPLALLALAVAAFGIGTTEFVIMGLLPDVARDLAVSIPDAGLLITGYALGVVFGAPILAVGTANMPRKATLLGMTLMFILG